MDRSRPWDMRIRSSASRGGLLHSGAALWFRLLAVALVLLPVPALAGIEEKIAALAPAASVLVLDSSGRELVARNADEPFVPASVTKIVTAWLAMEMLGGDYRFETCFYLDDKRVLYIRGGGDPFLVSEELAPLATRLVAAIGKAPITGIVLDASYYPSDLAIPGIEENRAAYNALNSALAVNFNTVYAVRRGETVRSAEKQTPITPLAISEFLARGPKGSGRISLSQQPAVSLRYAGELIAAFVERAGGSVRGEVSIGAVPAGLEPVLCPPAVARSVRYPRRAAPPFEQLHRQPGLPGDRRTAPWWAGRHREVASRGERAARLAWSGDEPPSGGGLGHQPRQPLHAARPRQGARAFRAPRRPASRP